MTNLKLQGDGVLTFDDLDGERRRAHGSWHRGSGCNFGPNKHHASEPDMWERFILPGWVPEAPVIKPKDRVMAVGSCFARSVSRYLRANRADLHVNGDADPGTQEAAGVALFFFGGGFVNTFTILQQFEWALGHKEIKGGTLFAEHPESFLKRRRGPPRKRIIELPTDGPVRERTREAIMEADAFIFTLGLSEVWFDQATGEVFFKAVPSEEFDPERHEFRLTTLEENLANIARLREIIRAEHPDAPIIFTLSPVPLTATFRPVSCVTANAVSKAILRVAIDQLLAQHPEDEALYYWPSYEMVLQLGDAAFEDDYRHVQPEVVDRIMRLFDRHFLVPARRRRSPRRRARAARDR